MKVKDKVYAQFEIDIEVPFVSYGSLSKNRKAIRRIKKHFKELLKLNPYIPLWIESCEGTHLDESSIKVKLLGSEWGNK